MCLAIPMRLIEMDGWKGTAELDGVRRDVSLALFPEVQVGDYLLVHAGYAIGKVDEEEARVTLDLLRQVAEHSEGALEP